MKNYDVYTITGASDKVEFIGVFEASTPIEASEAAKAAKNIKNCTMVAFKTGSERANQFAAENQK